MNRRVAWRFRCFFLFLILFPLSSPASDLLEKRKKDRKPVAYREISRIEVDTSSMSATQKLCLGIVSSIDEAAVDTVAPKAVPRYWTNGILTQLTFSQVSLTNWAEGGTANVSLNGLVDAHANYSRNKMIFENRLKLSYGFIQSFEHDKVFKDQFKKSDDKIQIDSKWGWMLFDRLYFSALFHFRTQLTPTYDRNSDPSVLKSTFMAPGYISVGLGITYRPFRFMSVNLSPVTGNFVTVTKPELREIYGNKPDESVRTELGAQLKLDIKYAYKSFKIGSNLTLFSNYLHHPENIQVYWDVDMGLALAKYFTLSLRTSLIYDDNIKIPDKNGVAAARVQFKEILGVGFTYTFGQYVKQG